MTCKAWAVIHKEQKQKQIYTVTCLQNQIKKKAMISKLMIKVKLEQLVTKLLMLLSKIGELPKRRKRTQVTQSQ